MRLSEFAKRMYPWISHSLLCEGRSSSQHKEPDSNNTLCRSQLQREQGAAVERCKNEYRSC